MTYTDRTLSCADCGTNFTFSADDQAYHAEKGFTNEPKRCPDCRAARRSQQGQSGGYSSGSSYGGQRELFSATCASCGKEAKVPFQPRGDKPVYCSDCFRSPQGGGSYSRSSGRGGGSSGRGGNRW